MGIREWQWSSSIGKGEREGPAGCMSGMFHFFDFHHLLFTTSSSRTPQHSSPEEDHHRPFRLKGVEAPRNSLELDEVAAAAASSSAIGEEYCGVPFGILLVPAPSLVKKKQKELLLLGEEEKRCSQVLTPRTPNVVARLMGLDVLPDGASTPTAGFESQEHSPKIIMKKRQKKQYLDESRRESPPPRQPLQKRDCNISPHVRLETGSRSLPDTPRVSSERSRDGDPRLSLQLNKENNNRAIKDFNYSCEVSGDHSLPPSPSPYMETRKKDYMRLQEENRSSRSHYYAREIVKQVKESINRRGSNAEGGDEENVIKSRRTRPAEKKASRDSKSKPSTPKLSPSCSPPPQNRLLEPPKYKSPLSAEDHVPKPSVPPKPPRLPSSFPSLPSPGFSKGRDNVEAKAIKMGSSKCKKASFERFTERIKRQPPSPEAAGRSDTSMSRAFSSSSSPSNLAAVPQKHLCSSDTMKNSSIPSFMTINKKEASHPTEVLIHPSSTIPTKGQQLMNGGGGPLYPISTKKSRQYNGETKEQEPEFQYVRSILERGGIMGTTPARWFSPTLPIDPFVFHQLELQLPALLQSVKCYDDEEDKLIPLSHRCNRKLLFHLAEEILGDLLIGCSTHTHKRLHAVNKELLLERVWSQIRSFPMADCQVIGDIDALVAGDLAEAKVRQLLLHPSVVEEAEDIALEIEQDVLDSLLGEAAASLALCSKRNLVTSPLPSIPTETAGALDAKSDLARIT